MSSTFKIFVILIVSIYRAWKMIIIIDGVVNLMIVVFPKEVSKVSIGFGIIRIQVLVPVQV